MKSSNSTPVSSPKAEIMCSSAPAVGDRATLGSVCPCVDPSQGTHFFQNLTSFGVGYFTINDYIGDGLYQRGALDAQPAVYESDFVRHVRFDRPLSLKIDGRKKLGFLLLPETE